MSSEEHAGQQSAGFHGADQREIAESQSFWRSKTAIVLIGFLLIGAFLLFSEHRLHALGYLPYLLVLACPLLHIFHHGHGGHSAHKRGREHSGSPQGR